MTLKEKSHLDKTFYIWHWTTIMKKIFGKKFHDGIIMKRMNSSYNLRDVQAIQVQTSSSFYAIILVMGFVNFRYVWLSV